MCCEPKLDEMCHFLNSNVMRRFVPRLFESFFLNLSFGAQVTLFLSFFSMSVR
jgi:hypothetical protein